MTKSLQRAFTSILLLLPVSVLAVNSDRMLVAKDGTVCYVDFENTLDSPCRDFVLILDHHFSGTLPPIVQGFHSALISNGVVKSIDTIPGKLAPNDILVLERYGDWLVSHVHAGERLQVVTARPFKPKTYTHRLDKVDTPIASDNQMAVYTSALGAKTPASVFRRELIVSEGRIVRRGGGNSSIPSNGFVVSGHGSSILWLSRWGMVGAKAEYRDKQVFITIDDETWFRHTQYYLNLVQQRLDGTKGDDLNQELLQLKQSLNTAHREAALHPARSWASVQDILAKAKLLLYKTVDSPADEVRGVYLADIPSSEDLDKLCERLKPAGINLVVMYVRGSLTPADNQRLNAMAGKLRAEKIKTVLWTWLPTQPITIEAFDAILKSHPEWSDQDVKGMLKKPDFANPKAMAWWTGEVEKFCRQTECDGVLFDYEGYTGGYSRRSINGFIAQEGLNSSFDPRTMTPGSVPAQKWKAWRKKLMVDGTHQLADAARQGKAGIQVVGCICAPGYFYPDPKDVMKDTDAMHMIWPEWVQRGTFDIITTMSYAQDAQWIAKSSRRTAEVVQGRKPFWPSLILYPETAGSAPIEPELLIDQIEGVRRAGGKGVLLFLAYQLMPNQGPAGDDLYNCLRYGLFRSTRN